MTTPGSALLFPSLAYAVGGMPAVEVDTHPQDCCGDRTATMPSRTRTRAQNRAAQIEAERRHNREARLARSCSPAWDSGPGDAAGDGEPPPF